MKNDLQKLKEELDKMLQDMSPGSQEALKLSKEVDLLIIEYYKRRNYYKSSCDTTSGFA